MLPAPRKLREVRVEELGRTIEDISYESNIDRSTYSRIERNLLDPSSRQIRAIEKAVGRPWVDLKDTAERD